MSTFKECTYNTITNTGDAINGRLVYSQLDGGNESKVVYFGLKDDTTWVGNLSTKGTSSFYLDSDTSGCTAQVKDSTYTPTTADANTAREIWLNIPKATSSRKIIFSYKGTTVLTVNQELPSIYLLVYPNTNSFSGTYLNSTSMTFVKDGQPYNEQYISINMDGYGGSSNGHDYFIAIEMVSGTSKTIRGQQLKNSGLTYVSGRNFITSSPTFWIAETTKGYLMNTNSNTVYKSYEQVKNQTYNIYSPSGNTNGDIFTIIGSFYLGESGDYMIAK